MQKRNIEIDDHLLSISNNFFTGQQILALDSATVSKKRSFKILTPHSFTILEGGEDIRYKVLNSPAGYQIHKKSSAIDEAFSPIAGFLYSALNVAFFLAALYLLMSIVELIIGSTYFTTKDFFVDYFFLMTTVGAFVGALGINVVLKIAFHNKECPNKKKEKIAAILLLVVTLISLFCFRDYFIYSTGANFGSASYQYGLSNLYRYGYGVKKDEKRAFEWVQESAKNGYPAAQYRIGLAHLTGKGLKKSFKKAVKYFQMSARLDYAPAMAKLGDMYLTGRGIKRNETEAFRYYQKGAKFKNPDAQRALGKMYYDGVIIDQDDKKAFKLINSSALQGDKWSQRAMGNMYTDGIGVEKDTVEAERWFNRAKEEKKENAYPPIMD